MSYSIERTLTLLIALCLLIGTASVVVLVRTATTGDGHLFFARPEPGSGCVTLREQVQKRTLLNQKACWPDIGIT
jgi:hypothetical protein